MSNVESITDELRNRVADALLDKNGLPPTGAALDVIMTVVRETERTDELHTGDGVPSIVDYAIAAEAALRVARKNHYKAKDPAPGFVSARLQRKAGLNTR